MPLSPKTHLKNNNNLKKAPTKRTYFMLKQPIGELINRSTKNKRRKEPIQCINQN
jgi:hypothetical protein